MWTLTINGIDIYHIISWFLIYSFLGWVWETAYVSLKEGEFINRGFINGPLCTIYGHGAVTVYLILKPLEANTILLYFGGVVMGVGAIVCLCFAMQEEYHALAVAGHRPVAWPTWLGMVLAVPLVALYGSEMIVPLLGGVCLLTMICVVFRDEPRLEDAVLSVLPLFTIVLPGMCIVALAQVQPKALQVVLLSLVFAIPVLGDTMAFFVGSRVRGPKLCPAVSPNKTISGAVAGLVGSLVAAAAVGVVSLIFCDQATLAQLPTWWQYALLGLVGGVAGQMGDLFASLVKRHCGIKDFSNLFPGHGGMLDRLDSILFMAVVMICYRLLQGI